MNLNKEKKIIFTLVFIITYVLLVIILNPIGQKLVLLQKDIIFFLFKEYFNYHNFIFVPFCSGIISIAVYSAIVVGLKTIKIKISNKFALLSIFILFITNVMRLALILLIEKISNNKILTETTHILTWFFMTIIILFLIKKTIKNI